MRVVVTGIYGLLGRYLAATAPASTKIIGTSRTAASSKSPILTALETVDPCQTENLTAMLDRQRPDVVIHTASEGRVDAVQGSPRDHWKSVVGASETIANWCFRQQVKFVQISSNAVFGESMKAHGDYDPLTPMNDYGRLKAAAEEATLSTNAHALIIRPILMYGWNDPTRRANPVTGWLSKFANKQRITAVTDVLTEPLYAQDCALAVWRGIELDTSGPVNVSGGQAVTFWEFATEVAHVFDQPVDLIDPALASDFEYLAPRPIRTTFDLKRLRDELRIFPRASYAGLEAMRAEAGSDS